MRGLNTEDAHEVLAAIVVAFVLFGALWVLGSLFGEPQAERKGAAKCDIRAN